MRAPTKRIERLIRERVPEAATWLDEAKERNKTRGFCTRCRHSRRMHGIWSEPEVGVNDPSCGELDCECEDYVERVP